MTLCGKDGNRYDCIFQDASGNDVGLMLTRDKNGALNYTETTDTALAAQYSSGEVGYTNFEPEKKVRAGQSDYTQGFGAEYYAGDNRYYYTIGADARFKDKVILGPTIGTIALTDYSFAITDGGMETWTNGTTLTNWTNSTATVAQEGTIKSAGTYSAKLSGTEDGYIYQDVAWNVKYRGVKVSVSALIYNTNVAQARGQVIIDDGVGTTTTNSTGSGAFAVFNCTHTMDASATRLRIILKYDYISANAAVYFDVVTAVGPSYTQVMAMAIFNNQLYVGYGDTLVKLNATADGFTYINNFATSSSNYITDFEPFGAYLFIGFNFGSCNYYYMSTAEALTLSTLSGVKGQATYFKAVGSALKKWIFVDSTNTSTVYSSTDPLNTTGDWDTGTVIGDASSVVIDKICEQGGLPMIAKEDGLWYIDENGEPQKVIHNLVTADSSYMGMGMINWQGNIYYPIFATLYEHNSDGVVTDISPSKSINGSSSFDGEIISLAGDSDYLYAIIDNSTNVQVVAGRWETVEDGTQFIWHSVQQVTFTGARLQWYPFVSKVVDIKSYKRLYMASTVASEGVKYIPITNNYGNISADSDYTYLTAGYLITSWMYCNVRDDPKAWIKITLTMSGTTADIYWRAYYQKLGDSSWTEINSTNKFKTSPTTTAYLPVDGSSNYPQSTMMRFKFEGVTNSTATSPVLLGYDVRAAWYPRQETIIQLRAKCTDRPVLNGGVHEESQSSNTIMAAIDALANPTIAWPRAFYPPYWLSSTDTKYVKLMAPSVKMMVADEKGQNAEWVYDLALLVIPTS